MTTAHRARGSAPTIGRPGLWRRLWQPFWAVPVAFVVAATVGGLVLPEVDFMIEQDVPWWLFGGGPDSARSILSTIASAMISVTGLVFSITMVILQLASSQFTPRILGHFLSSRVVQTTLGVFMSSFVFALTVLRSVRGGNDGFEHSVPQVSITLAFFLVLASMGCFLVFIHYITSSIQVSRVVSRLGDTTIRLAERVFPAEEAGGDPGPTWSPSPGMPRQSVVADDRHGSVAYVDYGRLVDLAREHDVVVTVDVPLGHFAVDGQTLGRVWGRDDLSGSDLHDIGAAVGLRSERSLDHDVDFGVRQLVDIAQRSLSPSTNDPTTTIQTVDELHRVFRLLVQRQTPSPYITDGSLVRVVHDPTRIDDLLRQAVEDIVCYIDAKPQVPIRLRRMLDDLRGVALERYHERIDELIDLVGLEPDSPERSGS